jgi:hypothetical protein
MIALTSLMLCGTTAREGCQPVPQPSNNFGVEVAATIAIVAGAVVGTIVLVEVNKCNHTMKGVAPQAQTAHRCLTAKT